MHPPASYGEHHASLTGAYVAGPYAGEGVGGSEQTPRLPRSSANGRISNFW